MKSIFFKAVVFSAICLFAFANQAQAQTRQQYLQMQIQQSKMKAQMWGNVAKNLQLSTPRQQSNSNPNYRYNVGRNEIGGQFQNDTSRGNAQFNRQQGNFSYNQKIDEEGNERSINGGYRNYGNGNFSGAGSYQDGTGLGYGGGVARVGNATHVNGNYQRPGIVPMTQERYDVGVTANGGKSSAYSGVDIYTIKGNRRIAGGRNDLNGQGFQRRQDFNHSNVRGNQFKGVQFKGINSTYRQQRSVNVGNVVAQNYGGHINRNGASANASMRMGRHSIGGQASVNSQRVRVGLNLPNGSRPSMSVNVPKVNLSVPKSIPKFSW